MGTDDELEYLLAKKMREMKKRMEASKEKDQAKDRATQRMPLSSRERLASRLVDRGVEVLETAESAYPRETRMIIEKLVPLLESGRIRGTITGGELLALFRSLGMRVSVQTTISVQKNGKLVSFAEKLKGED